MNPLSKQHIYLSLPRLSNLAMLVVICLVLLEVCRVGMANLYYFPASFYLKHWQQSDDKPAAADISRARVLIGDAVRLQPKNPHYLLTQAKIDEWAWYAGILRSDEIAVNGMRYQQAIAARPLWPVAYADQGYFLIAVQQQLYEGWQSVMQAQRLGRFLPDVHERLLAVAFSNWSMLSVAQKQTVFASVGQSIGTPLQKISIEQINRFKQNRLQCIYLNQKLHNHAAWPSVKRQLCQV